MNVIEVSKALQGIEEALKNTKGVTEDERAAVLLATSAVVEAHLKLLSRALKR